MNIDGAVCQVSESVTAGGIIRDQVGVWIASFTRNIRSCLVLMVEL